MRVQETALIMVIASMELVIASLDGAGAFARNALVPMIATIEVGVFGVPVSVIHHSLVQVAKFDNALACALVMDTV